MSSEDFDVFLSYSSSDLDTICWIDAQLQELGHRVWFDKREMEPSDRVIPALEAGINSSRSIAVIVGRDGFGPYHKAEHLIATHLHIERAKKIIPVYLPGAHRDPGTVLGTLVGITFSLERDAAGVRELTRGIGPRISKPSAPPVRPIESGARALNSLAAALRRHAPPVVFYVGGRPDAPTEAQMAARAGISRTLLRDLSIIDESYEYLLPWDEAAGTYYAVKNGQVGLEERVVTALSSHTSPNQGIAASLAALLQKTVSGRDARLPPAIVVSTTIDNNLEQHLCSAGVSFTRLVQHAKAAITVSQFGQLTKNGIVQRLNDKVVTEAPDTSVQGSGHSLRKLPLDFGSQLLLYKYHGSHDVPGSCALSAEDYLSLAVDRFVPDGLVEQMGNGMAVFLGCSPRLDPDVLHFYEAVLKRQLKGRFDRYVVAPTPDRSMDRALSLEETLWPYLKDSLADLGIQYVDAEPTAFLQRLLQRLS